MCQSKTEVPPSLYCSLSGWETTKFSDGYESEPHIRDTDNLDPTMHAPNRTPISLSTTTHQSLDSQPQHCETRGLPVVIVACDAVVTLATMQPSRQAVKGVPPARDV
jgi:hypothetical protein